MSCESMLRMLRETQKDTDLWRWQNIPIVRCRDCVYFDSFECGCDLWGAEFPRPKESDEGQGFCAWGKRKERIAR